MENNIRRTKETPRDIYRNTLIHFARNKYDKEGNLTSVYLIDKRFVKDYSSLAEFLLSVLGDNVISVDYEFDDYWILVNTYTLNSIFAKDNREILMTLLMQNNLIISWYDFIEYCIKQGVKI